MEDTKDSKLVAQKNPRVGDDGRREDGMGFTAMLTFHTKNVKGADAPVCFNGPTIVSMLDKGTRDATGARELIKGD